jgi:hypothetical protein
MARRLQRSTLATNHEHSACRPTHESGNPCRAKSGPHLERGCADSLSCDAIAEAYRFYSSGWYGTTPSLDDQAFRSGLTVVVQTTLPL